MKNFRRYSIVFLLIAPFTLAQASMGRPDVVRSNLNAFFSHYSANVSPTNSVVASLEPLRNTLINEGRGSTSARQWHYSVNLGTAIACCFMMLFTLFLTHGINVSVGFALTLWLFLFVPFLGISHEMDWQVWVFVLSPTVIIALRDAKIGKQLFSIISLVAIILFISLGLIRKNKFEYLDDFSYPKFITSSDQESVVIHERMNLPYRSYRSGYKRVLLKGERMVKRLSNEDLSELLESQAQEVEAFLDKPSNSDNKN